MTIGITFRGRKISSLRRRTSRGHRLLPFVARFALRTFNQFHLSAKRNRGDDKEECQEAHRRFFNEVTHCPTRAAAQGLRGWH